MGIFKTVFNHLFGSERTYEVKGLGIFTCKVCNWCRDESYTWSGMVKLPLYSKETVILMNGDASGPSPQQVSALWKLLENWKLIITQLDGMLHQESRFVHKDEIYASWQDTFLSGVYNWVCDYFFQARRQVYHGKGSHITDAQFKRVERNLKYLRQRSFREMVQIKGYRVFSATALAECCDMEYRSFRRRFKAEFGKTLCQWIREQRVREITYLLTYTNKTLLEIADEMGFSSPANLNDFCVKYMLETPGELRKKLTSTT